MGKQFRFIMDESDKKFMFEYVIKQGKAYTHIKVEGIKEIFELPNSLWINLYFYKDEFGNIKFKYIGEKKYINSTLSPVIEFGNTIVRTNVKEIQRGRLYLEMRYYDSDGKLLLKSEKLDEWYKELIKWIKKHLKCVEVMSNGKVVKEYVSESLVEYVKDGYKLLG